MILHVDPHAPAMVRDAATALLYAHIGGAFVGLVSGGVALLARKGRRWHRLSGDVFCVAMLTMSGVGALVAPFLPEGQGPNTLMGAFTFYLVSTGWAAVRRKPGEVGRFEVGAAAFAGLLAAGGVAYAWINAGGVHPLPSPEGPVIDAFAAVVSLAAGASLALEPGAADRGDVVRRAAEGDPAVPARLTAGAAAGARRARCADLLAGAHPAGADVWTAWRAGPRAHARARRLTMIGSSGVAGGCGGVSKRRKPRRRGA
jgi:uncharacterized membrane protein